MVMVPGESRGDTGGSSGHSRGRIHGSVRRMGWAIVVVVDGVHGCMILLWWYSIMLMRMMIMLLWRMTTAAAMITVVMVVLVLMVDVCTACSRVNIIVSGQVRAATRKLCAVSITIYMSYSCVGCCSCRTVSIGIIMTVITGIVIIVAHGWCGGRACSGRQLLVREHFGIHIGVHG